MAGVAEFSRKLDLVLKAFNLSRGRLAHGLGIDKSVISRWVSGQTVPTDHNLSLLTELVGRHAPGFGRFDWELDVAGFAARLGITRRAAPAVAPSTVPAPGAAVPAAAEPPSIAVLPFANLSSDPEQEYFADGITEDLITALSRWRSFLVIARNSTFTYKGRSVDVRQVGRELRVRYVLEGSVRRAGDRVRITAQLVESENGAHVWADRYDGRLDDVFDLQDQICASIVGTLEPTLQRVELQRILHKRPESFSAYDFYLKALPSFHDVTRHGNDEARRLLGQAIQADPGYALAHALLGYCHQRRRQQGWGDRFADDQAAGVAAAERALALGGDDPAVLWMAGHVITALAQDRERGRALIDRSLQLNPNCAPAWGVAGWNRAYSGQGREAIEHLSRALRLSPVDPLSHYFHSGIAAGHLSREEWLPMVEAARKSVQLGPAYSSNWRFLAVGCAHAGLAEEAANAVAQMLALEPGLTVDIVSRTRTNQVEPFTKGLFLDGLRRAGLPER